MTSMWQIIKQTAVRIGIWSAYGCLTGAQCGAMIGAMQTLPVSAIDCYPIFLRRGASRFFSYFHGMELFITSILISTFTFIVLGVVIGIILGAGVFAVLSFVIEKCDRPTAILTKDLKILKYSALGSFIGGFCCASSWCFLSVILKRDSVTEVGSILVVYIIGAFGGFAIGLFVGALRILRAESTTSSTR